ncbi:MAG: trigger factor [Ruminococcaceae bacterium]|nr:trigger factor [Oscillospiraceae bacterium]
MALVSKKEIEKNKVELEISVGAEQFEEACAAAYRKNVKKINVPGFRPGKAPRAFVEKMYGKEIFYEDAVNELYPAAYSEAVDEAGIEPVDRADVEIVSVDENGFTFKATVTVKPEVEVVDYKGIKATKNVKKVTEDDINAEIDNLRNRNGRIINVEDRAAENGDTAVIDYEGFVGDTAFEGGKGEKHPLVLGSNSFIPGFEEQVAGHNIGDEFDVNVTFPEEYHAPDLAGKEAVFKCKLHEIKVRQLPEVDDEFIKDVTEFDSLDEFKKDAEKKLSERFENAATVEVEDTLIDTVVENMKADIPECMFEHAMDDMVRDFASRLEAQGMKLEMYLQYTGMEMDAFRANFKEQAERQVKIRLALEKIAALENLAASEEEVEEQFKKMAEGYNIEVEQIKLYVPAEDIKKDLAMQKAIDFVRDNAAITTKTYEKEAPAKKAPAKKTAAKKADGEEKPAAKKPAAKKTTTAKTGTAKTTAAKKPAAKKAATTKKEADAE